MKIFKLKMQLKNFFKPVFLGLLLLGIMFKIQMLFQYLHNKLMQIQEKQMEELLVQTAI